MKKLLLIFLLFSTFLMGQYMEKNLRVNGKNYSVKENLLTKSPHRIQGINISVGEYAKELNVSRKADLDKLTEKLANDFYPVVKGKRSYKNKKK